jgi:hypothetical protein
MGRLDWKETNMEVEKEQDEAVVRIQIRKMAAWTQAGKYKEETTTAITLVRTQSFSVETAFSDTLSDFISVLTLQR